MLYSVNLGGYDAGPVLHPGTDRVDERVLFSDVPIERLGWRNVVVPHHFEDTKRTVQYLKTRPDLLFGEEVATVWVDGSLHDIRLDAEAMDGLVAPPGVVVAAPPHRRRTTLRAEARTVEALGLDTPAAIRRAVGLLDAMGFPDQSGLSATLFVYRDLRDARVRAADSAWQRMILRGSRRDQLSFNAAYWSAGLRTHDIPVPWAAPNALFTLLPHRRARNRRVGDDAAHPAFLPVPDAFVDEAWTHADVAILRDLTVPAAGDGTLAWGASPPADPAFSLPSPALAAARMALSAAASRAACIRDETDSQGIHAALCLRANPAAVVLADLPDAAARRLRRAFGDRLRSAASPGPAADLVLLGQRDTGGVARVPPAPGASVLVVLPPDVPPGPGLCGLVAAGWREEAPAAGWLRRLARP
ncbi:hypothetical protein Rmf_07350 [Roseomonas fluvialis]|uniref:Uncharacterized protein n=1 Tax=Roseomonas fluvialis TaxID=1750527 RepID=A0ABM7XZD4_9PROT|nr:hypothetical protein Rmf_07350 [Roseomonas fluvialis]